MQQSKISVRASSCKHRNAPLGGAGVGRHMWTPSYHDGYQKDCQCDKDTYPNSHFSVGSIVFLAPVIYARLFLDLRRRLDVLNPMLSLIRLTKALLFLVEGLIFLPDLRVETLAPSLSFNREISDLRCFECFFCTLLLQTDLRRRDRAIFLLVD